MKVFSFQQVNVYRKNSDDVVSTLSQYFLFIAFEITRYPDRQDYSNVLAALMMQHPFLADFDGSSVS